MTPLPPKLDSLPTRVHEGERGFSGQIRTLIITSRNSMPGNPTRGVDPSSGGLEGLKQRTLMREVNAGELGARLFGCGLRSIALLMAC